MNQVRHPAVAGMFYPASGKKLENDVRTLLSIAQPAKTISNVFGIVSPHAGYIYSGKTAAYGFNLLKNKEIENVIIISPSHREYFPGISVYNGDAYETPLGIAEVNNEIANKLVEESKIIFRGIEGHRGEHAVEVQIPFLQVILSDFRIVPIVMGDQGDLFVDELAEKLSQVMDDKTVVVASSDLSHYYSGDIADRLDSIVEKRILDFDLDALQKDFHLRNCEACGGGAIVAMMKAASILNKRKSEVLYRCNSGDTTKDYSEVVGYLSAVIYG
jgi:AmmeMemoRadiSam system protein B